MPMLIRDPVVDLIFCVWFFLFGSCVGSFLNVVVYRLPLRKSLAYPPSFCPICGHPIRWFDNIPVLGWIQLGGKCRDCKSPISIRYPLIEALCGLLYGGIATLMILYLPEDTNIYIAGLLTILAAGLLTVLLAVILIRLDKRHQL